MKSVNSDVAYNYIRKRILNGQFAPGFALMTNTLAGEIGVSRTPVRDALRQLEADGLVTIQARLGAHVKIMDITEFSQMCELRMALESHAALLAARKRNEVELNEMRLALENMRDLTEQIVGGGKEALLGELVQEDIRFHVALMTAAKNPVMKAEILRLHLINRVVAGPQPAESSPHLARLRHGQEERRWDVLKEHEAIYDAVAKADPGAAKIAMEQHLQGIIDALLLGMGRGSPRILPRKLSPAEASYQA